MRPDCTLQILWPTAVPLSKHKWCAQIHQMQSPTAGSTKKLTEIVSVERSERKPLCLGHKKRIWQTMAKAHDALLWKSQDRQPTLHVPSNHSSDYTQCKNNAGSRNWLFGCAESPGRHLPNARGGKYGVWLTPRPGWCMQAQPCMGTHACTARAT